MSCRAPHPVVEVGPEAVRDRIESANVEQIDTEEHGGMILRPEVELKPLRGGDTPIVFDEGVLSGVCRPPRHRSYRGRIGREPSCDKLVPKVAGEEFAIHGTELAMVVAERLEERLPHGLRGIQATFDEKWAVKLPLEMVWIAFTELRRVLGDAFRDGVLGLGHQIGRLPPSAWGRTRTCFLGDEVRGEDCYVFKMEVDVVDNLVAPVVMDIEQKYHGWELP